MAFHKSGHPESNSEYGKSLSRIAKEIDRLVMYDSGMNHFRDCIRPFGKRWNDYLTDLERDRQKCKQHWEKVKLNPKWQDKNAGPPKKNWEWDLFYLADSSLSETVIVDGKVRHRGPEYEMPASLGRKYVTAVKKYIQRNKKENKQRNSNDLESTISHQEGKIAKIQSQLKELSAEQIETARIETDWGWWRYLDMSEEKVFGCWRPPIKIREDPFIRLQPGFDKLTGEAEGLPEPKYKAEEYERYYVYLTSIHDNMLPGCGKINNDIWPEQLSEKVWSLFKWEGRYGPYIPFIEAALERVKADPAKKPAEIQQSQQTQTPPEIELIEQIATRLKQWTQKHPDTKRIKPLDFHDVCYGLKVDLESATDGLNDILFYLRENSETGKAEAIEKLYGQLLHSVSVESHSRSDGLAPMYLELDSTKKLAALLARELQNIMPAGTEQKIEPVRKPLEAMTDKDRQLFLEIEADIKKHAHKYHEAGKWLDEYYSVENFWQRKEAHLRTLYWQKKSAEDTLRFWCPDELRIEFLLWSIMTEVKIFRPISELRHMCETKADVAGTEVTYCREDLDLGEVEEKVKAELELCRKWDDGVSIEYRLLDACDYLLEIGEFVSAEQAKCICLVTWLLTDPDADAANLGLTKFEKWPWENPYYGKGSGEPCRAIAIILIHDNKDAWMKLVRRAWAKLEVEKTVKGTESAERSGKPKSSKKPKAEVWNQIAIEVLDNDTIRYKVSYNKWERANYTELGFLDNKRKDRANKLWPIFLGLASKNLPSNINRPRMESKDIDRIRDTLRKFFGTKGLPIKYDRQAKEYRCNFSFNDPRDWTGTLKNENLAD